MPGSHRQSFLRKFRSQETVRPCAFASLTAASTASAAVFESEGVMPVVWNQPAPANTCGHG